MVKRLLTLGWFFVFTTPVFAGSISRDLYNLLVEYDSPPDVSKPWDVIRVESVVCDRDDSIENATQVSCTVRRMASAPAVAIIGADAMKLFKALRAAGVVYEGAGHLSRVSAYSLACLHTLDGIEDWYNCQAVRPLNSYYPGELPGGINQDDQSQSILLPNSGY